jgi:hypothetical protein
LELGLHGDDRSEYPVQITEIGKDEEGCENASAIEE